jgi:hypothetical protein
MGAESNQRTQRDATENSGLSGSKLPDKHRASPEQTHNKIRWTAPGGVSQQHRGFNLLKGAGGTG